MAITKRKNGSYNLTGDDANNLVKALRGDYAVEDFNKTYSVGDKVRVLDDFGNEFIDTIKNEATVMGGHTAMAWLENKGSFLLERVIGKA